jgi:hypothetical protein
MTISTEAVNNDDYEKRHRGLPIPLPRGILHSHRSDRSDGIDRARFAEKMRQSSTNTVINMGLTTSVNTTIGGMTSHWGRDRDRDRDRDREERPLLVPKRTRLPKVSLTVDLPTIRPSAGIYSPVRGGWNSGNDDEDEDEDEDVPEMPLEEEEEEEEDEGEAEARSGSGSGSEMGKEGRDERDQRQGNSRMATPTSAHIVSAGVEPSEDDIVAETANLLNHRMKLLEELHLAGVGGSRSESPTVSGLDLSREVSESVSASVSDDTHTPNAVTRVAVGSAEDSAGSINSVSSVGGMGIGRPLFVEATKLAELHPSLTVRQCLRIAGRARNVANYLSTYYSYIEEYQVLRHEKYVNVDGVWNPLQIMRNRRVRMHRGEKLKKFSVHGKKVGVEEGASASVGVGVGVGGVINTVPGPGVGLAIRSGNSIDLEVNGDWRKVKVASRMFSKHHKVRLIWQIGLHEIIGDLAWREDKWHDIRGPDGKRWFPKHREVDREQEKLVRDGEKDNDTEAIDGVGVSSSVVVEDDMSGHVRQPSETLASVGRFKHYQKANSMKREEPIPVDRERELDANADADAHAGVGITASAGTGTGTEGQGGDHIIDYTPGSGVTADTDGEGDAVAEAEAEADEGEIERDELLDAIDEMVDFVVLTQGIQCSIAMNGFELQLRELTTERMMDKRSKELSQRLSSIDKLEAMSMQRYRELQSLVDACDELVDEQRSYVGEQSSVVEELLGYCIRSSGAINTGITLNLRNLHERADALMKSGGAGHGVGGSEGILYGIIETMIVGLLWFVWVVVESWLLCKRIGRFIVRVVKWVII